MSSQRIKRAFESSGSSSRANASLEQIQLAVEINFMVGPETVQSVHPWGFIVPGEVVANDATVLATNGASGSSRHDVHRATGS